MSCCCTGVIHGAAHDGADALLTALRALLAGTPVHLFCPPLYREPFLRELPGDDQIVLSFADNPIYDNCDQLFRQSAADCMRHLAEAAALILGHGCGFELFVCSDSDAALADYAAYPVTPDALQQHLTALCHRREPGFCIRFILRND